MSRRETASTSTRDNDTAEFRLRLRDGDLEENVAMDVTGGGTFFLLVEDTDIDIAAGATDAFSLVFSDVAQNGEITFRDNNDFSAAAGRALFIDSDGSAAKVVDLLIEDSDFFSATNAIAAADIRSRANTTMNATIEGNMFDAPGAANDFDMQTDTATGRIRLKLGDEDAADMNIAGGGGGTFLVQRGARRLRYLRSERYDRARQPQQRRSQHDAKQRGFRQPSRPAADAHVAVTQACSLPQARLQTRPTLDWTRALSEAASEIELDSPLAVCADNAIVDSTPARALAIASGSFKANARLMNTW